MSVYLSWTLIGLAAFVGAALGIWIDRELRLVPKSLDARELERRVSRWSRNAFQGIGTWWLEEFTEPHVHVKAGPYDWANDEGAGL